MLKALFPALLCFTGPLVKAANPSIDVLARRLSPNWAHEYMGTDLVRQEIKSEEIQKVDVAIFDSGFEKAHITLTQDIFVPPKRNGHRLMRANHGTAVASLFNGPAPYGTTDNLNLINLTAITYQSQYSYAFYYFEKNGRYPKIISNSLGWTSETTKDLATEAHERGILWFLAAGNAWPKPIKEHEVSSKALLVGSFSPSGLTSFETQSDDRLLVLAAANEELPAINGKGEYHLFGATSGATPIVAATVTNLVSLLPNLTRSQVFELIQKTAFSSAENKRGNLKAPGLLNAYKAFKVALRIKKQCQNAQTKCVEQALASSSLFSFQMPLQKCATYQVIRNSKPEQANAFLQNMRRANFLTQSNQQSLELACAYRSLGFNKNAEFYQFLASPKLNLMKMQQQAAIAIERGLFQISYYRYLNLYTPEILEIINRSVKLKDFHKDMLRALY